jgi:16S rRNA (guanine966-N2)-methyltransferase
MRIIGGTHRGRRLAAPKGPTRPTTDRTREAVFNLLQSRADLRGARVLDLFAGSGALGLEALSRGAAEAVFVEKAGGALGVIRENAAALGFGPRARIVRADALRWLERGEGNPFDLAFADPPYALDGLVRLPDLVLPHLVPGGLLVLEHGGGDGFEAHPMYEMSRAYGQTVVSVFRAVDSA